LLQYYGIKQTLWRVKCRQNSEYSKDRNPPSARQAKVLFGLPYRKAQMARI